MLSPTTEKTRWTLPNGEIVEFPRGFRQEAALRLVQPGSALLDVGCGRGAVAAALAPRFTEVHGVDADDEALRVAASRGVRTRRVDLARERLPYRDGLFAAVLCLEVIEHILDPAALARELARVLQPGGRLYLSTPNIRFVGYLRQLVLRGRFPLTSDDPCGFQGGHLHFFTFADVEHLLRASGFDQIENRGLGGGRCRLLLRAQPRRLAREFFAVGIFTIARRADGPVPEPARPRRELRSA